MAPRKPRAADKPEPPAETSIGEPLDVKPGETTEVVTTIGDVAPGAEVRVVPADPPIDPEDEDDITAQSEAVDRRAALANIATAAPDGVAVPTIVATDAEAYTSGKEYDWSDDTDESSVTVVITGSMVTTGYRTAMRGDKVTLAKSVGEKFVNAGSAVKA